MITIIITMSTICFSNNCKQLIFMNLMPMQQIQLNNAVEQQKYPKIYQNSENHKKSYNKINQMCARTVGNALHLIETEKTVDCKIREWCTNMITIRICEKCCVFVTSSHFMCCSFVSERRSHTQTFGVCVWVIV